MIAEQNAALGYFLKQMLLSIISHAKRQLLAFPFTSLTVTIFM